MAKFESALELAQKIDWEGGAIEAIAYGIRLSDLAAIDNLPPELIGAWAMAEMALEFFQTIDDWAAETLASMEVEDAD